MHFVHLLALTLGKQLGNVGKARLVTGNAGAGLFIQVKDPSKAEDVHFEECTPWIWSVCACETANGGLRG